MHKLIVATTLAASASFASFASFADDAAYAQRGAASGAFVHLGLGRANHITDFKGHDGKTPTSALLGGYRWRLANDFALGFDGGLVGLGQTTQSRHSASANGSATRSRLTTGAWVIGMNAKWYLTETFALESRVGVAWTVTKFENRAADDRKWKRQGSEVTRNARYIGLGASYALTDSLDLGVQLTRYGRKAIRPQHTGGKPSVWSATTYTTSLAYRF
ncbi:outer membrane beta-barrel protein [Luteibacter sp. SG786]|uniref:outer membrane protein n=1 Tax=Luteibacter sp. SG786 TaxID=2587130 RepID=UPI00141FB7EE|nr:outer membrane beta-barrel protein [Luteibacter sp. SG786]NII55343.1 OOP family OmpA-OmpF porin/outer membrane immunogenic protein [Luteibacter sp. SG786]